MVLPLLNEKMEKREELKKIGESIKKYRIKKKLTQANLAEMANISVQTLSNAEIGKTELRIISLIKISVALKVSLDDLTQQ